MDMGYCVLVFDRHFMFVFKKMRPLVLLLISQ